MNWFPYPVHKVPLLADDQHCLELIRFDFLEGDPDAEFQSSYQVQFATDKHVSL
jgi:hypothetical protein